MARQITIDAIRAFRNGNKFKRSNTEVKIFPMNTRVLLLHGNIIAQTQDNVLRIGTAGWKTVTTKERLNGFPTVNIVQKDFQWFLNGEAWNGEYIEVDW